MTIKLDDYRLLGRSGLRVSPLALGTMTFGIDPATWGSTDDDAARMIDTYLDRGGNFIDTANFYGNMGGAETALGQLLDGRRERIVISTKYSLTMRLGDPNASGNSRKSMVRAVEDSLRRLKTDYIDLFYLHMWDFRTPVDEVLRGFDDLVRHGKVLYIGLSDVPAWEASRMQAIAELRGWTQFCALQIPYSLVERTVEREMIPMARRMGMGVCPWSPLGGGVLTGKYLNADIGDPGVEIDSRKAIIQASGRLSLQALQVAQIVREVARDIGKTSAQVALAWTMLDRAITSPVIGARTLAQLLENLGALDVAFSDEHIRSLDQVSAVAPVFPLDILHGAAGSAMHGGVQVEERD